MKSYSETNVFTTDELALLGRATAYVARVDEDAFKEPIRCHELARAVGRLLRLEYEDGVYSLLPEIGGGIDHSWLLVPRDTKGGIRVGCSILDVYAIGSLPQVQLLHCGTTAPHHENFINRGKRDDIDEVVVEQLVQMMRMSKYEAVSILAEVAKINPEALRLAAQLIGYAACPTCDYALPNCMCVQSVGDKHQPTSCGWKL